MTDTYLMHSALAARAIADQAARSTRAARLCPTCGGSGETVNPDDLWRHPHDPDLRYVDCWACGGSGYR